MIAAMVGVLWLEVAVYLVSGRRVGLVEMVTEGVVAKAELQGMMVMGEALMMMLDVTRRRDVAMGRRQLQVGGNSRRQAVKPVVGCQMDSQ